MVAPLYKSERKMTECKNVLGISLLSVAEKTYSGVLMDRVYKVTEELIDDEQRGFRSKRECVDQIIALKELRGKNTRKEAEWLWFFYIWKRCMTVNREGANS